MYVRAGTVVLLAAFAVPHTALAQPPSELQTRFEQEPNVIRQAKLLTQLSGAYFQAASEQIAAGDNTGALKMLEQLVDDAQHCSDQLDAEGKNPESNPSGFKELQFATRESLRRIDDVAVRLTTDEQTPFLALRKRLDQLDRHLIHELFPRQPEPPPPTPGSNGPQAQPETTVPNFQ